MFVAAATASSTAAAAHCVRAGKALGDRRERCDRAPQLVREDLQRVECHVLIQHNAQARGGPPRRVGQQRVVALRPLLDPRERSAEPVLPAAYSAFRRSQRGSLRGT